MGIRVEGGPGPENGAQASVWVTGGGQAGDGGKEEGKRRGAMGQYTNKGGYLAD